MDLAQCETFLLAFNLYLKHKHQVCLEFKDLLNLKDAFGPVIATIFERLSCMENVPKCIYKINQ